MATPHRSVFLTSTVPLANEEHIAVIQSFNRPSSAPSYLSPSARQRSRPLSATSIRSVSFTEFGPLGDSQKQSQDVLSGLLSSQAMHDEPELEQIIPRPQKPEPMSIAQCQLQGLIPTPAPLSPAPALTRPRMFIPQAKIGRFREILQRSRTIRAETNESIRSYVEYAQTKPPPGPDDSRTDYEHDPLRTDISADSEYRQLLSNKRSAASLQYASRPRSQQSQRTPFSGQVEGIHPVRDLPPYSTMGLASRGSPGSARAPSPVTLTQNVDTENSPSRAHTGTSPMAMTARVPPRPLSPSVRRSMPRPKSATVVSRTSIRQLTDTTEPSWERAGRSLRAPTIINFLPVDEMTQEEAKKAVFHIIRKDGAFPSTQVITTMKKTRRRHSPKRPHSATMR